MKFFKNRKGLQISEIGVVALVLVISGITLGVGALITTQIQSNVCPLNTSYLAGCSAASCCASGPYFNQSATAGAAVQSLSNATSGVSTLASWLPTISIVVAAAIIIGIVFSAFIVGRKGE